MRGFLAVFERELAERRLLVLAALAFGLIAVALPLIPGLQAGGLTPADVRGGLAIGFALLLSSLTALFLGGSVLASDLLERRIGFYFSRPLSGWTLWLGKVTAALVLIFGASLLVLLPALLTGSNFDVGGAWGFNGSGQLMSGAESLVLWAFGLLLLFFLANAVGLIVRSRSPWAALDIVALVLVVSLIWQACNRLLMAGIRLGAKGWWPGTINIFAWIGNTLVVVLLAALVAAGAVQVIRGRTDVRRAHRALSATLWGTLFVFGIAFQIFTLWWVRVSPSDLQGVANVASIPEGSSWIAFSGPAAYRPGYVPSFFYDVASGRSLSTRMGSFSNWWGLPVRISADGSRAVWPVYQGLPGKSPLVLQQLDLKRPGAEPEPSRVLLAGWVEGFALSPDGRRIAIATQNRLRVEDLETGRLLASVAYEGELWFSRLAFAGPDRIRLYRFLSEGHVIPESVAERGFDILELDLKTGKLEQTGGLSDVRALASWSLSRDGELAILRNGHHFELRSTRTGGLIADLGTAEGGASASVLQAGWIALVSSPGELRILDRDGVQELRRFRFPGARAVVPVDEPAPGSLRVVTSGTGRAGDPWDLKVLDLRTGAVRSLGQRKLVPLVPPSSPESRLSLESGQGVIWKEPLSLRWRVVLRDSGAV